MSDTLNNPDFNVVILGKGAQLAAAAARPRHAPPVLTSTGIDPRKLDEETAKLPTASHDFKVALQQARSSKGLSQDQLNEKLSLPKGTIRDYESGKTILNSQILNKINRILGSSLKVPK
jgi:ribosome-binding protein aMBF1 (putative translation factor)